MAGGHPVVHSPPHPCRPLHRVFLPERTRREHDTSSPGVAEKSRGTGKVEVTGLCSSHGTRSLGSSLVLPHWGQNPVPGAGQARVPSVSLSPSLYLFIVCLFIKARSRCAAWWACRSACLCHVSGLKVYTRRAQRIYFLRRSLSHPHRVALACPELTAWISLAWKSQRSI